MREINVLLVEDDFADTILLRELLAESEHRRFNVTRIDRVGTLSAALADQRFDVVLLDLFLPDSSGLETLDTVNATLAPLGGLPVVVLTGLADESMAVEALKHGAQDFVVKGSLEGDALARTILCAIERRRLTAAMRHASMHDDLTGLANRHHFFERLHQAIHRAQRRGEAFCLAYFDLDGFKAVNDTFGHLAGDEVLRTVARRMADRVRAEDTLARLGGDEFACIYERVGAPDEGGAIVADLRERIIEPIEVRLPTGDTHQVSVGVSIGLAFFPRHGRTPQSLLAAADSAMYGSKAEGSGAWKLAELQ